MSRLHRLVGIVLLLQSRRVVRAEDIAQHFGISVRTAYRDLRAIEEAGVPIAAEAGIGYSLADGYHLPPVIFTREEASAIFIGGEFAVRLTDESLRKHARSAIAKIRAVLPASTKGYLEELEHTTAITIRSSTRDQAIAGHLATVQDALVGRHVLRIEYYTVYRDSTDTRDVEPLGLLYYGDSWHLIGYCRLRSGIRDFRIDRIGALDVLEETFTPRKEFSLAEYTRNLFGKPEDARQVRVHFTRNAMRFASSRHYFGLIDEKKVDDGVEMTFLVVSLEWIASWLLSFGSGATILHPPELRDILCRLAREVMEKYAEA